MPSSLTLAAAAAVVIAVLATLATAYSHQLANTTASVASSNTINPAMVIDVSTLPQQQYDVF